MIKINSFWESGLYGVNQGLRRMDETANNIARAGTTQKDSNVADVAKELVDLKVETLDIKASLKVLKTGEELVGALLDEFA